MILNLRMDVSQVRRLDCPENRADAIKRRQQRLLNHLFRLVAIA